MAAVARGKEKKLVGSIDEGTSSARFTVSPGRKREKERKKERKKERERERERKKERERREGGDG